MSDTENTDIPEGLLEPPRLVRQIAIVPDIEESQVAERDENIEELLRRTSRISIEPDRLLTSILHDVDVQEFYYEDVPSDLEAEEELDYSDDEEWLAQRDADEIEEYVPAVESDDSILDFVVDVVSDNSDSSYEVVSD